MGIALSYEWDAAKAKANYAKHGVRFADATAALEDDLALTMRDPYCDEEERWVTMGKDALGRILVVVYAWRGDAVRLISARRASAREKKAYEEHDET
ncbi:MAG TPA: BrnT family toxin [Candidatus Acidoferrum sp.]|nr:BrnT family toxin [Candidatus Acidoferrum sp.]